MPDVHPTRPHTRGNTAAEYVLSAGLLIIVGGIVVFGSNMKDAMRTFFSGTINSDGSLSTMKVAKWGSAVPPSASLYLPPLTAGNEQFCFSKVNACLTVPVISNNRVDTAGALGGDVVTQLAVVLDQLPAILKALKAPQPVIDLVTDLANEGHSLGGELTAVQSLCPAGETCQGSPAEAAKSKVDTIKTVGTSALDAKYQKLVNYLTNVNPGALNAFPEAKTIITQKVGEIKGVINGLNAQDQLQDVALNTGGPSFEQLINPANIALANANSGGYIDRRLKDHLNDIIAGGLNSAAAKDEHGQSLIASLTAAYQQAHPTGGASSATVNNGTVVLGNTGINQVHQDANTICNNGGADCLQKQLGADWVVIKSTNATGGTAIVNSSNTQINTSATALVTPAPVVTADPAVLVRPVPATTP